MAERGGALLGSLRDVVEPDLAGADLAGADLEGADPARADLAGADLAGAAFAAVRCRDAGLLPAVARLAPAQAIALLITRADATGQVDGAAVKHSDATAEVDGAAANDAFARLSGAGTELYALKHGWVGGPEGSEGAVAVSAELVASVLDAAADGAVEWERDPDFGYEVAASVPGLEPPVADALRPRLLYAYNGRVYEHAALVPRIKRERAERLDRIEGLDPRIAAALG